MSKSREELEKKLAALEKTAIEADLKVAAKQRSRAISPLVNGLTNF